MPQMSPTWWMILFLFNVFVFILINMLIYFKWSPFYFDMKKMEMKWKNFLFNDKNF
uniref:ATP synthase F0 subunit 8 n=1 Tax=Telenomus remus TaxID=1569972 RepID=UPI001BEFFE9C|nr:ATP synthase F0 subunit 8 [Telenomus remus]QTE20722.1 ATP synthase F0 subunit 8 [Telenomus remus]QUJ09544.1 ATP synthase F0 subunit 8 [Telenomus remus]